MRVARHFSGGNECVLRNKVPSGTAESRAGKRPISVDSEIQSSLAGLDSQTDLFPPVNWRATFTSSFQDAFMFADSHTRRRPTIFPSLNPFSKGGEAPDFSLPRGNAMLGCEFGLRIKSG